MNLSTQEKPSTNKPTICVAGQNILAVNGLQEIVNRYPSHLVCYIPTAADQGVDTWQPSLIKKATALGLKRVSLEEVYAIENLIFISLQFTEIIKTKKFKSPHLYNVHFSKLPKYKGVYPAVHPILNGEKESGVTLHLIDDGIDTGDIIAQATIAIDIKDTSRDLYLKQTDYAFKLLKDNLDNIIAGQCMANPQSSVGASYYSKSSIKYAAIQIDFNKTAFEIYNQFRAFTFREYQMPFYQCWSISSTNITQQKSVQKPGALIEELETHFLISTIDYNIKLVKDYYPLLWAACESGSLEQIKQALPFIEEINLRNQQGWSALIIAAYHGHLEIVEMLLKRGAMVNSTNYKGTTALMYALSHYENSHRDAVFQYLIKMGADVAMTDMHGKTIKDYITEKGFKELLSTVCA